MSLIPRLLAIDDDPIWLEQVPLIFGDKVHVDVAESVDVGLVAIENQFYDIVLLDLNFDNDPRTGLDLFRAMSALDRAADIIVISGETNPSRLIEVFNVGVTRFISKPASPGHIRNTVFGVLENRKLQQEVLKASKPYNGIDPFLGISHKVKRLKEQVFGLIQSGFRDLLIQGETGTGKEVFARYIASQADSSQRFYVRHCGAITDGLAEAELFGYVKGAFTGADQDRKGVFEAAQGAVVFLDEIGEMPLSQQAKLLRVLQERTVQRVGDFQERKVSFKSISATNIDLQQAIAGKMFREDLYYRIARSVLTLPALRERREDIPFIVKSLRAKMLDGGHLEFSDGAMELLMSFDWPGNMRQLVSTVENIAINAKNSVVREKDVCAAVPSLAGHQGPGLTRGPLGSYGYSLLNSEKKRFESALIRAQGNRDEAAKLLGLSRATYFRRARELGLSQRGRL